MAFAFGRCTVWLGPRGGRVLARVASCCAVGVLVAGCNSDLGESTVSVVDSAGVRITISQDDGRSFALVDSVPLLSLGGPGAEGPAQFSNVRGVRLDAGGTLWVVDGASNEARRFSLDGVHRSTVGGSGEGPGEFRRIRPLGEAVGDTVLVWDEALSRLTVLDPSGEFVRNVPLAQGEQIGLQPRAVYEDGSLLVVLRRTVMAAALEPGSVLADTSRLARLDMATGVVNAQASVGGPIWIWNGRGQAPVPFTVNAPYLVQGDRVLVSSGPEFRVHAFSDGALLESFGLDRVLRPVTESDVRAYVDLFADAFSDSVQKAEYLAPLSHPLRPDHLPAYDQILTDDGARVWASVYAPNRLAAATWDVYDPDRAWLGTVETPAGFAVMGIAADKLVGVWRDDFGVEYVRVYGLTRPPR